MNDFLDPHRRSGRTTRIALAYVNECIYSPGKVIQIKDHTGLHTEAVRLTSMVKDILKTLNVKANVNVNHCLVCVEPLK